MSKEMPRGYGSDESAKKIAKASAIVAKSYSGMKPADVAKYLASLGAGRVLALHNFDVKEAKEAKAPKSKGKKK